MTKEAILKKHGIEESWPLLQAMDEWAKQQAIEYCSWYCSIGFLPKVKHQDEHKPGETYMKSHEELYAQFIEQQNKK